MPAQTPRYKFLTDALRMYDERDGKGLLDLAADFCGDNPGFDLSSGQERELSESAAEIRKLHGEMLENKKIAFLDLTPRESETMMLAMQILSGEEQKHGTLAEHEFEALDAHYARGLVELIPRIVDKTSSLQQLDVSNIPNKNVQAFFIEAHRCYFFSLNQACIVLCRAILESALKDVLGADNNSEELLKLAEQRGILDSERLEAAKRVRKAGNRAIHVNERFRNSVNDQRVEEVLFDTRKILEDLYSQ